jgi:hypothetical protein
LAEGVQVQRKPVVGQGEFEWGHVVITPGHPEGAPCSSLVAHVVSLIDGKVSIDALRQRLVRDLEGDQAAQVATSIDAALQVLYVEGAVEELYAP